MLLVLMIALSILGTWRLSHLKLLGILERCWIRLLPWLPVEHRISYKINLLTFKAIHGEAPLYLQEHIQPYQPARQLRSATQRNLARQDTAKTGKRSGGRAFSVSAVLLWNNLSTDVKTCVKLDSFKKALKTFYFKKYFSRF